MKPVLEHLALPNRIGSVARVMVEAPYFPYHWHHHPEWELTYVIRGNGTRMVGDSIEPYGSGDLVLLGPDLPHCWYSDSTTAPLQGETAIVLHFAGDLLADLPQRLPEFEDLRALRHHARRGLRFPSPPPQIREAMEAVALRSGIDAVMRLLDLLDRLSKMSFTHLTSPSYQPVNDERTEHRLSQVFAHMQRHIGGRLPVRDVAKIAGMTPSTFSRFFKSTVGQTYAGYVTGQRIAKASGLLIHETIHIAEVAYQCGYNNLSNFNRQFFEAKQMTPRQYRRRYGTAQRI